VPHPVADIVIHPSQVVLVTKRGDVITLDNDLNVSNELDPDDGEDRFMRSFSYPRTRCTFLPNDIPPFGEIMVLFLARRDAIRIRVLRLAREDGVTQVTSVELDSNIVSYIRFKGRFSSQTLQTVTDITCSESGNISFMCMSFCFTLGVHKLIFLF